MTTFNGAASMGPPRPTNLRDALQEIRRLSQLLIDEREKQANRWEEHAHKIKAMDDVIKHFQARIKELETDVKTYQELLRNLTPKETPACT